MARNDSTNYLPSSGPGTAGWIGAFDNAGITRVADLAELNSPQVPIPPPYGNPPNQPIPLWLRMDNGQLYTADFTTNTKVPFFIKPRVDLPDILYTLAQANDTDTTILQHEPGAASYPQTVMKGTTHIAISIGDGYPREVQETRSNGTTDNHTVMNPPEYVPEYGYLLYELSHPLEHVSNQANLVIRGSLPRTAILSPTAGAGPGSGGSTLPNFVPASLGTARQFHMSNGPNLPSVFTNVLPRDVYQGLTGAPSVNDIQYKTATGWAYESKTANIAPWAQTGNLEAIPRDKLVNSNTVGLTQTEVDGRVGALVENFAKVANPTSTIPTARIADAAITTDKIADGSINNLKLEDDIIDNDKIQDDGIGLGKIATQAAPDIKGALETLTGTNRLDASAVQNLPMGGGGGLTQSQVRDLVENFAEVGNAATIPTAKIADDAVTQAKLADDSVGSDQIADDAVNLGKIDAGAGPDIKAALEDLSGAARLEASAVQNLPTGGAGLNQAAVDGRVAALVEDWAEVANPAVQAPASKVSGIPAAATVDREQGAEFSIVNGRDGTGANYGYRDGTAATPRIGNLRVYYRLTVTTTVVRAYH